jgi:predicted transcriptional regulator
MMSKEAVFTMKLESDLRAAFMAEAEAADRPASQILREMMREFIQRQRQAREYEAFLAQKVALARESVAADRGIDHADVEAEFAKKRAEILHQT